MPYYIIQWSDSRSPAVATAGICRLLHGIAGRFGQPRVIGEIVAGLLLGPCFFGWIAPALYMRLFPAASLPALNELSQIGLVLFMFMVIMALVTTMMTTPVLKIVVPEEYRRTALKLA